MRTARVLLATAAVLTAPFALALAAPPVPTWVPLSPATGNPAWSYTSALMLDRELQRALLYTRDAVWECPLDGAGQWQALTVAGHPPIPSEFAYVPNFENVVFDPVTRRIICAQPGGEWVTGNLPAYTSALALDALSLSWGWLNGGGTLQSSPLVLDESRRRLVSFGGHFDYYDLDGTAAMNLDGASAWAGFALTTKPIPRSGHAGVWDPARRRMWIFCGTLPYSAQDPPGTVWYLDLAPATPAWHLANVAPGPAPNYQNEYALAWDTNTDRMLMFTDGAASWEMRVDAAGTTVTWNHIATQGTPPPGTTGPVAAFDADHNRMLVFVGRLWALDFGRKHGPEPLLGPAGRTLSVASIGGVPTANLALEADTDVTLEAFDVSGRRTGAPLSLHLAAGRHTEALGMLSGAPRGLYFVRATMNHDVLRARVAILE